jgi:hypothetical protein
VQGRNRNQRQAGVCSQWGRGLLSSRLIQGLKCTHQSLDPGVLCRIAQISLLREKRIREVEERRGGGGWERERDRSFVGNQEVTEGR